MGGGWTNNNYPTQYGFRVLKNGVEVYQSIDLPTTQTWSQQHFDFAGLSDFTYTGNTTYEFELLAYNPIGNGYSMNIWDVDQFSLWKPAPFIKKLRYPGRFAGSRRRPENEISLLRPCVFKVFLDIIDGERLAHS